MSDFPKRGDQHRALEVFLGRWTARGTAYGNTDQSGPDSKANGRAWMSTHDGQWHTGSFFLIQNERATIGEYQFDTLSVMGVSTDGKYFARTFENHGFYREYEVTRDGDTWRLSGPTERATICFTNNNREQKIAWEWKPAADWLPLCDRTAILEE